MVLEDVCVSKLDFDKVGDDWNVGPVLRVTWSAGQLSIVTHCQLGSLLCYI